MSEEGTAGPPRRDVGSDLLSSVAVVAATSTSRSQLRLLLAQDGMIVNLQRFARLGAPQRAGHVFEWHQELTFNLDAIAKHSKVRAVVTEWLGEPHAPADLRLLGPGGRVVGEVQAKVVSSTPMRVSPDDGLAAHRYDGMQLVTPSDHAPSARDLLDRRLAKPVGVNHDRYTDVRARITDRVTHDDVCAATISTHDLDAVTEDPGAFLDSQILANEIRQIATAAAAGGAAAALVSGVTTLAHAAVRDGSLADLPWAEAGRRAAASAVRGATVGLLTQTMTVAAESLLSTASSSALVDVGPTAVARAVVDIAVIAHGVATGRLARSEAAAATADVVSRGALVWMSSAVGQAAIPVPVLGAVVGGIVGQFGATLVHQGVRLAMVGRMPDVDLDPAYEELLAGCVTTTLCAEAELAAMHRVGSVESSAFRTVVLPCLDRLAADGWQTEPDSVLTTLADLTRAYGATPLFATVGEFDAFMASDAPLTLKLQS